MTQAQTTPHTPNPFRSSKQELLQLKAATLTERKILTHWRTYEPQRVEALLATQSLRQTLSGKAEALLTMQRTLETTEQLDPALARLEAWNRLMKSEDDARTEAEAWGMTLEAYQSRT